jgi:hypothetical protein
MDDRHLVEFAKVHYLLKKFAIAHDFSLVVTNAGGFRSRAWVSRRVPAVRGPRLAGTPFPARGLRLSAHGTNLLEPKLHVSDLTITYHSREKEVAHAGTKERIQAGNPQG